MAKIQVKCSKCGAALMVPEELIGREGRCPNCRESFIIELPLDSSSEGPPVSEGDVLDWLSQAATQHKPKVEPPKPRPTVVPRRRVQRPPKPTVSRPHQGQTRNAKFPVELDHVDDMGAFFRFDSRLLYNEDFRSSFPQRCLICGAGPPLSVHLVFWASKLKDRARVQPESMEARQVYTLRKLSDMSGRDLLDVLDPIENLPEPYSLPFPYYVCSSCSAVGAVVTDVHPAPDGQGEVCELGISSLPQAEGFVLAVCGEASEAHQQIREAIRTGSARPWQRLPLTVRIRIRRWYEPREGERFLMYIPDAEFAKAEAGLAGLVLTDSRLIYHKSLAHVEIPRSEKIEMSSATTEKGTQLIIVAPNGRKYILRTNPPAIKELRQLMMRTAT